MKVDMNNIFKNHIFLGLIMICVGIIYSGLAIGLILNALEQMPVYQHDMVDHEAVVYILLLLNCMLFIVIGYLVIKRRYLHAVFTCIVPIISICWILSKMYEILMCIAPELILIGLVIAFSLLELYKLRSESPRP